MDRILRRVFGIAPAACDELPPCRGWGAGLSPRGASAPRNSAAGKCARRRSSLRRAAQHRQVFTRPADDQARFVSGHGFSRAGECLLAKGSSPCATSRASARRMRRTGVRRADQGVRPTKVRCTVVHLTTVRSTEVCPRRSAPRQSAPQSSVPQRCSTTASRSHLLAGRPNLETIR
jgi:hypothetical protein